MTNQINPALILISGKRYSGKDTLAGFLNEALHNVNRKSVVRSTALLLKTRFCQQYALDLNRLLNDRVYKEQYRNQLTKFSANQTQEGNIKLFIESLNPNLEANDFVIISDWRTKFDLEALRQNFKVFTVRVSASDAVRATRGHEESEYDSSTFESELDNESFDFYVTNEGSLEELRLEASILMKEIIS